VAFYSFQNPQGHVYIAGTAGGGLRQLTGDAALDRVPRWSPDGNWIAFFSNRAGEYTMWKIRPDGRELQQMANAGTYAAWSPDRSRTDVPCHRHRHEADSHGVHVAACGARPAASVARRPHRLLLEAEHRVRHLDHEAAGECVQVS
jgi:dipeptidyl aminopeptidase/acylaminoacyl peptidase